LNAPVGDSVTVTAFGIGGAPGEGFKLEANGNAPDGQNVRKPLCVAFNAVQAVGAAIRQSAVVRDELFITTVIQHDRLGHDGARESIATSLERLGLDRIDLVLISAPLSGWDVTGTASALNEQIDEGLVMHAGARYMSQTDLDHLSAKLNAPLLAHLTELHPLWHADQLRQHAVDHAYWIIADSPLMQGMAREVREIRRIAERAETTPWRVVLSWLHNCANVATSTWTHDADQMSANLTATDVWLDPTELAEIDQITRRWTGAGHLHLHNEP